MIDNDRSCVEILTQDAGLRNLPFQRFQPNAALDRAARPSRGSY